MGGGRVTATRRVPFVSGSLSRRACHNPVRYHNLVAPDWTVFPVPCFCVPLVFAYTAFIALQVARWGDVPVYGHLWRRGWGIIHLRSGGCVTATGFRSNVTRPPFSAPQGENQYPIILFLITIIFVRGGLPDKDAYIP